ncbi:MAG: tRNA preQ1(34) S-adenosylmethionine ribosyltransferase-isomerase QueA [Alphaproteobacteria bacterium]
MRVDQFDFELPEASIALRPATPRDSARLLHVPAAGELGDLGILDLPDLLQPGDLLVLNNTRVIPARLMGVRPARDAQNPEGATIEITLHQQAGPDAWRAFAKNARRLKLGDTIVFSDSLSAVVNEKADGGEVLLVFGQSGDALAAAIAAAGVMPLPPYIASKRAVDERDADDYQTMFARQDGSVAAPTASLHFTDRLFRALADRDLRHSFVTLHVGAGTFLPVKADDTNDHKMHSEWGEVDTETARAISETHKAGNRVVAVGTTALRLVETAARDCSYQAGGELAPWQGDTDIFITPGFQFRAADLLITNFHLPRSTLFMLVSAFAGLDRMKTAYNHAIETGYRFYSYGDGSLLERAK